MRYDFSTHLVSSATHVFSLLQTIIDDADLKKAHQHALQNGNSHPNLNGCVDSPEASTLILMAVGTVGIFYGSRLFLRLARRHAAGSSAT